MIIQWDNKYIQGIRSDRQSVWRTVDRGSWHCTEGRDQDHPQEKKKQKFKTVAWGGLTIADKRREVKGNKGKEDISILMQSSKK